MLNQHLVSLITENILRSNIPKVHIRLEDIRYEQRELIQRINSLDSQLTNFNQNFQDPQAVSTVSKISRISTSSISDLEPTFYIPATISQRVCSKFCICNCHKTTNLKTPTWMQDLVGALFVGYSAIPTLTSCNEIMCNQNKRQLITISYYFPSWLVKRMIYFKYYWTPKDGGLISVKTPRVVRGTSHQVMMSRLGSVSELQKLFSSGLASPFDVTPVDGVSCLQVC